VVGQPCKACATEANRTLAARMIAEGASDQKIADAIGNISRAGIQRHRRNHIEAPAKAIAEAASKGRSIADQRKKLLKDVESDDVAAFIGLASVVSDLKDTRNRLKRMVSTAEEAGQLTAAASLVGQQHRSVEVRSRLGGLGSYAPAAAPVINLPTFSVNFMFSEGRTEQLSTSTAIEGDTLDVLPEVDDDTDDEPNEGV
jgi:hypothetical protein